MGGEWSTALRAHRGARKVARVVVVLTLLALQGPDKGKRFELPDRPALVGRDSPNVKLQDNTCSRRHAELRPAAYGERWTVRDLGSSNGTYVNGQRVFGQPTALKQGDQLRVGKTLLLFGSAAGVTREQAASVAFEDAGGGMDSAIISTLPGNEDSIVLAVPEPAAAAMGNLKVLYRLAAALGSQFSDEQVLDVVLDLVFETVRADRAVAMLFDEHGELVPRAVRRREDEMKVDPAAGYDLAGDATPPGPEPIRASRTIIGHVLRTGEGVLCSNAMTDRRFASGQSVQNLGIRSALCVPIKARRLDARVAEGGEGGEGDSSDTSTPVGETDHEGNEQLGVLYVDSSVQNYTYGVEQLRLLTAIGLQTGLALQNAKLYRQGLHAERMAAIGETAAALSHSIKNILQALRGGANVVEMARKRKDWGQMEKGWGVVDRNLERIYNLTLNLLAYSKPRRPSRRLVNPGTVIQECLDLVAPLARQRGAMAVGDVADDQPAVPLDADGLHQVLMNLLTNALDALDDESVAEKLVRVVCRYEAERRQTVIQVIDTGKGIHPNVRRHLFELFHSTKGNRGTGLGLPVAKKIVEEHGGMLDLFSAPGKGTTFTITLPAFAEQADDPSVTHFGEP